MHRFHVIGVIVAPVGERLNAARIVRVVEAVFARQPAELLVRMARDRLAARRAFSIGHGLVFLVSW